MKTYRYMIGMLLCVWLLAACDNSNAFDEYAKFDTTAQTAWGQSIVDGSNGYVAHVKSDRTYNLADGVDVLEMAFLADDGLAMQLFLFKIALSDKITLRTTLADDKNQVGTGQTIMKQLEAMRKNGRKVLGGTNADFFNTTTFIPYGVCWRDGVDKSEGSKWFFGGFWGEPGSSWDGRLNEQVSASTMIEAMALLIE